MPLCEYCNINPCRPSKDAAEFAYRQENGNDQTTMCFVHHYTLGEMADCAFGHDGCVLCELFLLSWHRSFWMGQTTWKPRLPLLSPEGDERFQIRWIIDSIERKKRSEPGSRRNNGYGSAYGRRVFTRHPSLHDRLYLSCSLDHAHRSPYADDTGLDLWAIKSSDTGSIIQARNFVAHLDFYFKRECLLQDSNHFTQGVWRREVHQRPNSQAALAVAGSWLRDRLNRHHLCRDHAPARTRLPSRVLDLGLSHNGLRLLVTRGAVGQFVALSYCWGGGASLQWTRDNLAQLQQSITLSELPQVIRDAVLVTRAIGLRYLWVDALCIIQDVHHDWTQESAQMHDTYGKATLVLIAATSAAADETFLHQR
nr:hypothetical protein CFP56_52192 [Quercus suber]